MIAHIWNENSGPSCSDLVVGPDSQSVRPSAQLVLPKGFSARPGSVVGLGGQTRFNGPSGRIRFSDLFGLVVGSSLVVEPIGQTKCSTYSA
ncbi:hypothetical protein L484_022017 [Morus notabilis]|uniref:Uncharacterized protein n=1 Tax=Morus notabilis TaxID=981085 RepID=W9SDT0_9ROSA|nr:hypothetical protein L484_022017 [Morus notabilis]